MCSVRGTADGSTFSFLETAVWNDAVVAGVVGSRSLSATLTMDGAIPSGAAGASGLACLRFSHAARRWTQGSKWTGWENLFQENNQGFSVGAGLLVGNLPLSWSALWLLVLVAHPQRLGLTRIIDPLEGIVQEIIEWEI